MVLGQIGSLVGGAFGGPLGSAAGGAIGGGIQSIFGGGGGSRGADPSQYLAFAQQAAAQNAPITAEAQALALLAGAYAGQLGRNAGDISFANQRQFQDAFNRAQAQVGVRTGEAAGALSRELDLLAGEGRAALGAETLNPEFTYNAGRDLVGSENLLARNAGQTNVGLRKGEEESELSAARDQAYTVGDVFDKRAAVQGQLALGQQSLNSNLALQEAAGVRDLAKIQAQAMALAGTRAFA